jgi:anaerobic selenocysteine-containing dehydrogenase
MSSNDVVRTTCPRDCYDACGIAVVRKNGAISKVLGDPNHPISRGALCGKCAIAYNGAWRDESLRLANPLRRTGSKGSGQFEKISWSQALEIIAQRFTALSERGKARSIIHTHYTGTVGLIAGWYPLRFFNRLGATEVDPDTVCNKAGHVTLELIFGNSLDGFDPRTVKDTRTLLIWGANPSHSAPHQNKIWIKQARAAGAKIIVVDPISHGTARDADIHLKLFPGSDVALALAFLNVLEAKGLTNEAFISQYVTGAEHLRSEIAAMTPARASALCGVDAELIETAAVAYAKGPSLLWLGQGVQRQPRGGSIFRMLSALVAFTGNLAKPGAGFLYMNGPGGRGIDMGALTCPSLAQGTVDSISHMDLALTLEDSERARVFVNWNNNPAASSPDQRRLRTALSRDDLFHVAIDLFHTDTTAYADIVLPAASFLEFDDLVLSYFDLTLSAQSKAGESVGESLSNQEIFRRLARAMNYSEPELFEDDASLLERLVAQTPFSGSFEDLRQAGTVTLFSESRVQFAGLTFATPSGRIELASERLVESGIPLKPEPGDSKRPQGTFRVLSPAAMWLMNSSYGNDKKIRERLGEPVALIHKHDADNAKLQNGDHIELQNDIGTLKVVVRVSDEAQPGMMIVHKGRWPSDSIGHANVNVLVSGQKSDVAQSTTVHGTEVTFRRVNAHVLERGAASETI